MVIEKKGDSIFYSVIKNKLREAEIKGCKTTDFRERWRYIGNHVSRAIYADKHMEANWLLQDIVNSLNTG